MLLTWCCKSVIYQLIPKSVKNMCSWHSCEVCLTPPKWPCFLESREIIERKNIFIKWKYLYQMKIFYWMEICFIEWKHFIKRKLFLLNKNTFFIEWKYILSNRNIYFIEWKYIFIEWKYFYQMQIYFNWMKIIFTEFCYISATKYRSTHKIMFSSYMSFALELCSLSSGSFHLNLSSRHINLSSTVDNRSLLSKWVLFLLSTRAPL